MDLANIVRDEFINPTTLVTGNYASQLVFVTTNGLFLVQERDTNAEVSARLGRPIKIWLDGAYGPIGGGVEKGEDPVTAGVRECNEELDINLLSPDEHGIDKVIYIGTSIESDFKANDDDRLEFVKNTICYNILVLVKNKELFDSKINLREGKRVVWESMHTLFLLPTPNAMPRNYNIPIISSTFRDLLKIVQDKYCK